MTILAQHWLEGHDKTKWDEWLRSRLQAPAIKAPHTVMALADRIVVQEDVTDLMYEMAANKQIVFTDMLRHTHMPSEAVWIEWRDKHTPLELGVLIDTRCKRKHDQLTPEIGVMVVVRSLKSFRTQVMFVGIVKSLPFAEGDINNQCELAWTYHDEQGVPSPEQVKDSADEFARSFTSAVFTLFVMQHPKLIDRETVEHGPALQKKRAEKRKPALLDYSRVYIKINKKIPAKVRAGMINGKDARVNSIESYNQGPKKKYHKVLGHFRTYHRGEPEENIKWIAEHWRGDPSLGVVLHEHRLTKGDA